MFHRLASIPETGHDVFRVRMIGHEILLLDMHVCNSSTVVAPYRVLIGSSYRVEVLHLYANFTFEMHPPPIPQGSMNLAVLRFLSADDGWWGCAWDESCHACTSGDAEGRWVVRTPRELGGQLQHCTFASDKKFSSCGHLMHGLARSRAAVAGMEWQPYQCKVLGVYDLDIPACLAGGRKLCFVGDSQMRHVMLGVSALLQNDSSYYEFNDTDTAVIEADLQRPLAISAAEWFQEAFGTTLHNLSACTDVIMNFGQWPASYVAHTSFWPFPQYRLAVENAADLLHSMRVQGKRVWWLSTISGNTVHGATGVNDWRSDPVISAYNQLAWVEMGRLDIPMIDTFHVVAPLHDLAYDRHHFKGIVGHNVDLHVLNTLCHSFSLTQQ